MDYTTDELIEDLRSRINAPISEQTQNPARFIRILNRAMMEEVVPHYMTMREDFFLAYVDTAVPVTGIVDIPVRAIGLKLKDVTVVSGESETGVIRSNSGPRLNGGFFYQNTKVVFAPVIESNVRLWYYRRPGFLSKVSDCAEVLSVNTGTGAITCRTNSVPDTWVVGTVLDAVNGQVGFESIIDDAVITAISGDIVTISPSTTGLSNLGVGDWLAPQYHSPIPQIPVDGHGLIAQKASRRILAAMGAMPQYRVQKEQDDAYSKDNFATSQPRADDAPKVIVQGNWADEGFDPWPRRSS